MKKTLLIATAACFTLISMDSCKKAYVCSCSDTKTGLAADHRAGFYRGEKKAKGWCDDYVVNETTTCKLTQDYSE